MLSKVMQNHFPKSFIEWFQKKLRIALAQGGTRHDDYDGTPLQVTRKKNDEPQLKRTTV